MSTVNGFQVGSETLKYNYESLENYNTPEFSTTKTYAVGDYVMYQGKLYKCTTAVTTAGSWSSSNWALAVLSDDVSSINNAISELAIGKNIVGSKANVYYPVYIKPGTTFTMSTSDGSNLQTAIKLLMYNENKQQLSDYWTFRVDTSERTVTQTAALGTAYYMKWDVTPPVPLQVEIGSQKTVYEPYFGNTKYLYAFSEDESEKVNTLIPTVAELSETVERMDDLEYAQEKLYLDDLTYGRIEATGSITAATYIAYSPQMRTSGDTWYFDSSNFRLYFAYYENQADTTPVSMSSWITSSPFTVPTSRPYYKIMVSRLTNAGTLDIPVAQASTYRTQQIPSDLIDAGILAGTRLKTAYVSATTGDDANSGTTDAPYATIQKALNSGAAYIYVEEGTYAPISCSNRNYPIKIALWGNSGANKKIKITSNGEGTAYGVNANNCLSVTLSDIWVDNVPRHLFCAVNTKEISFIRCIASNNSTAAYMGYYIENTNAFFYDCIAHDIAHDGFNFHGFGNSYMQNCVAYDCNDDGVSHHDKCTGSIVGGEFYGCGKGGVASPTYGANINIYNVYSHNNNYGLFAEGLSDRTADIKARVSGCAFLNNTTADIKALYGEVVAWGNIYNTLLPNNNAYTELHSNI